VMWQKEINNTNYLFNSSNSTRFQLFSKVWPGRSDRSEFRNPTGRRLLLHKVVGFDEDVSSGEFARRKKKRIAGTTWNVSYVWPRGSRGHEHWSL
jgi:hypothetical protein